MAADLNHSGVRSPFFTSRQTNVSLSLSPSSLASSFAMNPERHSVERNRATAMTSYRPVIVETNLTSGSFDNFFVVNSTLS